MGKSIYGDTVGGGGGSLKKIPQADWNQTDNTQLDYIKNKPDIDVFATTEYVDEKIEESLGTMRDYYTDVISNKKLRIGDTYITEEQLIKLLNLI